MVSDDLPHMLWWHVLFLSLNKTKLSLLAVTLRLKLLPFPSCRDTVQFNSLQPSHVATDLGSLKLVDKLCLDMSPFSWSFSSESGSECGKGCLCRSNSG